MFTKQINLCIFAKKNMKTKYVEKTNVSTRVVMPGMLNSNNSLFGGEALKMMDEIAYITARNYLKSEVITVGIENLKFIDKIFCGDILIVSGRVVQTGNVKIKVLVEISVNNHITEIDEVRIRGVFSLAGIDSDGGFLRISNTYNTG